MKVPERGTQGIDITELPSAEHPIARLPSAVTAFVGRTLRGPVNRPVRLTSFAEFQKVFGGLWQPSTLSYAVEQYFEQGGHTAVVVRVINGGAPATIALPCASEQLVLEAIAPGTREFLRASVDYDNIRSGEDDSFNLVIQRVRSPGSERIEDQEIFRRLSINPQTNRYVSSVLSESMLVRVKGAVPLVRPDVTQRSGAHFPIGYVDSNPDGDDGGEPTEYDIIGSAVHRTGLFALEGVDGLSLLCIPPLGRNTDVGAGTLLVAARLCRERRMMLIVDPPASWDSADAAIRGLRELGFASDQALMFFPRLLALDRLRGRYEIFANCGAVAGMLARGDEQRPPWALDQPEPDLLLRPGTRPALALTEVQRWRLANAGINALQSVRSSAPIRLVPRTLAGGANAAADWAYLGPRRFSLLVVSSIEYGTRWVVLGPMGRSVWRKVAEQVSAFLRGLAEAGAFPGVAPDDAWFVVCDERVNSDYESILGLVNIVVGFSAGRSGRYHSFMITHSVNGSHVKTVAVNRLESTPGADARALAGSAIEALKTASGDS